MSTDFDKVYEEEINKLKINCVKNNQIFKNVIRSFGQVNKNYIRNFHIFHLFSGFLITTSGFVAVCVGVVSVAAYPFACFVKALGRR